MNILAVDIGNSDVKFGFFQNGRMRLFWRASQVTSIQDYKDGSRFASIIRASLAPLSEAFDGLVYCSVVPEVDTAFRNVIQHCYPLKYPLHQVAADVKTLPIRLGEYPPGQIGCDRLVNACGAHLMFPERTKIIVDFGTATTFDVINAEGVYLGGAIIPGIKTFTSILSSKASQLSTTDYVATDKALGTNTQACLQGGHYFGYKGMIKEILAQLKRDLVAQDTPITDLLCVATGGGAEQFINETPGDKLFDLMEPTMTLKGLFSIYLNQMHAAKAPKQAQVFRPSSNTTSGFVKPTPKPEVMTPEPKTMAVKVARPEPRPAEPKVYTPKQKQPLKFEGAMLVNAESKSQPADTRQPFEFVEIPKPTQSNPIIAAGMPPEQLPKPRLVQPLSSTDPLAPPSPLQQQVNRISGNIAPNNPHPA